MITVINANLDDFIPKWHNPKTYVKYSIIALVTEGRLIYRLNDVELQAEKGDLVYIPYGTQREAFNMPDVLHQKYTVLFQIQEQSELFRLPLVARQKPRKLRIRSLDYLKERFALMYRHYLEKRDHYELICKGIMTEILGMVHRELSSDKLPSRKLQYAARIEQYIMRHFREVISLKTLAELIDRSPNYTLSLFKEVMGLSPVEYQHKLRVHAAIEMLEHTDLTIAAIADHLGYYDASAFYKMFKKHTGLPPSSYQGNHGWEGEA